MTRVFVGCMELATTNTEKAVESAFANNDTATLALYKRFLDPIVRTMINQAADKPRQERLRGYLNSLSSLTNEQPK